MPNKACLHNLQGQNLEPRFLEFMWTDQMHCHSASAAVNFCTSGALKSEGTNRRQEKAEPHAMLALLYRVPEPGGTLGIDPVERLAARWIFRW
jgi:hypothetical protein